MFQLFNSAARRLKDCMTYVIADWISPDRIDMLLDKYYDPAASQASMNKSNWKELRGRLSVLDDVYHGLASLNDGHSDNFNNIIDNLLNISLHAPDQLTRHYARAAAEYLATKTQNGALIMPAQAQAQAKLASHMENVAASGDKPFESYGHARNLYLKAAAAAEECGFGTVSDLHEKYRQTAAKSLDVQRQSWLNPAPDSHKIYPEPLKPICR